MLDAPKFLSKYNSLKAAALKNRYITNRCIEPLLTSLSNQFSQSVLGTSEGGMSIHGLQIGTGSKRILIWSQMHGNESTTTKALFDLFNYFELSDSKALLEACTLFIIPILNPDGADAYTRLNKNQVDLNRDAKVLTQSESQILRSVYKEFKPDFCFNMHGQRTIFSAGNTSNSAVLSFLSPSENDERSLTTTRQKSMEVIQVMNSALQQYLPNQIGRYDDGYNDNCVGDYFQTQGTPTVLFEAGHFPKDYNREETRKFMALALMSALDYVANNSVSGIDYKSYFDIPENDKLFYDVIVRKAQLSSHNPEIFNDIGIQYTEVLVSGSIVFKPKIVFVGDLKSKQGHFEIDADFKQVSHPDFEVLSNGNEIDFIMIEFTKNLLFNNNNLM
tara:strand:- start:30387 stop:31553 length:1167 start_codon:yes stop_codon:yes gene_type:complete